MPRSPSAQVIAIFGPGLLGGSLAMAVRRRLPRAEVRVWARRDEAVRDVKRRRIASLVSSSVEKIAEGANFVILATPVEIMPGLAKQIARARLAKGCVITDVGSVKGTVVRALEPIFSRVGASFVGSHPMAGSEQAGIGTAREDLFAGAVCILTPTAKTAPAALKRVRTFWKAIGCQVMQMTWQQHDRRVARISHLPHAMAAVTVLAALHSQPETAACSGPGFRDTTRVAGGDPLLWAGILRENRKEVRAALRDAKLRLTELLEILDGLGDEKLRRFLSRAQELRRQVPAQEPPHGID